MKALEITEGPSAEELKKLSCSVEDYKTKTRLHSISLIREGLSIRQVCTRMGVSREAIRQWIHRYLEHGAEGLYSRKPSGRPAKLTVEQMNELNYFLKHSIAAGDGYSLDLTLKEIAEEIRNRFGVTFSIAGVHKLLKRFGLQKSLIGQPNLANGNTELDNNTSP